MTGLLLPELRWRRLWVLGGTCIILLIAYMCLVPGDDVPDVQISDKLVHFLMFLVPALWFGGIMVRGYFPVIGLALLVYAGLTELAQGWTEWGRESDWRDLVADAAGIITGLLLARTPLGRWAHWLESLLRRFA